MSKTQNPPQLSKPKKRLFKVGAIAMAFLFLLLVEVVLRVVGYGKDYPLFIENEADASELIINPDIGQKHFFNPENATKGLPRPFKKEKEDGTFRIFIMGASTAVGYPYKHHGGFQHWLEYALHRTYPNQNFEIINTALTAVNSHTLSDFTDEIIDQKPDVILIYAGHNEYYGALGVGSTSSLGNSPWVVNLMLSLREVRLVQLITNGLLSLKSDTDKKADLDKNLMEKMVEDQKIPYDSKIYKAGIHQFEINFKSIVKAFEKQDIPTFLSTIVSNEKDLKPFISDSTSQNLSAKYFFGKGTEHFDSGNYKEAKSDFIKAKELDMLRFRAPEAMNNCIVHCAEDHDNITLIDSKANFENQSDNEIIGNNLLLEHVHPNLKGYAIIGFSFYDALAKSKLLPEGKQQFSLSELESEMPVTALDSLEGNYEVMMLKDGWPYYEPFPKMDVNTMTVPQRIAGQLTVKQITWQEATISLYEHYIKSGDSIKAQKVVESMTLKFPDDVANYINSGILAAKIRQAEKSEFLLNRAIKIDTSQQTLGVISRSLIEANLYKNALPYLKLMKQQEAENGFAHQVLEVVSRILELRDDKAELENDPDKKVELAENYLRIGKRDQALLSLESVLATHPNHEKAIQMLNDMKR